MPTVRKFQVEVTIKAIVTVSVEGLEEPKRKAHDIVAEAMATRRITEYQINTGRTNELLTL